MLRTIISTVSVLLVFGISKFTVAEDCIKHDAARAGNNINLTVANRCGSDMNVNVCVHIAERKPDPNSRAAAPVPNGQSYTFGFVDFDNSSYKYTIQWCGGSRVDGCPAQCPNVSAGEESGKMKEQPSNQPRVDIYLFPGKPHNKETLAYFDQSGVKYNLIRVSSWSDPALAELSRKVGRQITGLPAVLIGNDLIIGSRDDQFYFTLSKYGVSAKKPTANQHQANPDGGLCGGMSFPEQKQAQDRGNQWGGDVETARSLSKFYQGWADKISNCNPDLSNTYKKFADKWTAAANSAADNR